MPAPGEAAVIASNRNKSECERKGPPACSRVGCEQGSRVKRPPPPRHHLARGYLRRPLAGLPVTPHPRAGGLPPPRLARLRIGKGQLPRQQAEPGFPHGPLCQAGPAELGGLPPALQAVHRPQYLPEPRSV